jgi:uncharacterized protein (DUF433 family)
MEMLASHIDISPDVRHGKPRIAGTRITVADVAIMHLRLGLSIEEIAGKYDVSLSAVHESLAFAEAFQRNNPSPLQQRLNALTHG